MDQRIQELFYSIQAKVEFIRILVLLQMLGKN